VTKNKVIFHLDEPSKGRAEQVLSNIANLLNDMGEDTVEVELLANGGGVYALVKRSDGISSPVESLSARGVRFVACPNSMDHLNIPKADLLDLVQVVPAGVSELVRKQNGGWAYIRP
jgi:uncharacterized protein